MSLIDRALKGENQQSGEAPPSLSVPEAFAAILVASIAADGALSADESLRLEAVLSTSRILPSPGPSGEPNVIRRALNLLTDHGVPAVMAASAQALPPELRPTAFAQAADLVLSDARIAPGEKTFVDELQDILEIDDALALKIVEVMLIKNRG